MRTHKVGTLTLGFMLIFFGALFLIHLFTDALSYRLIFDLWPVIFLFLGGEVLLSALPRTEQKFQFSTGAIVLVILLALFAMAMAGVDTALRCAEANYSIWFGY